ncbi:MAG: UPF0158 family protein [Nonlabens sp.]
MENSRSEIIRKIAEEIDCGYNCHYNPKNDEIITIPNFEQDFIENEFKDNFSEKLKKVKQNKAQFIKIEVLESYESFKIMEQFADQVDDEQLSTELKKVLERKKPFQNFKFIVDNSDYRQNWFDFKQAQLEEIVKAKIKFR